MNQFYVLVPAAANSKPIPFSNAGEQAMIFEDPERLEQRIAEMSAGGDCTGVPGASIGMKPQGTSTALFVSETILDRR